MTRLTQVADDGTTESEYISAIHRELLLPVGAGVRPDLLDKCLRISGAFEGCGYAQVTGNMDGQGLSMGILQWCIGQGSLQPMLREFLAGHPDVPKNLWGEAAADELKTMLATRSTATQVVWASTRLGEHENPQTPWAMRLRQMASLPEYILIQQRYAQGVFDKAVSYVKSYRLASERSLAYFFDTCVQQGGINDAQQQKIRGALDLQQKQLGRGLTDREQCETICRGRTAYSNPRWQSDVMSRRLAIIRGHSMPFDWAGKHYSGTVHGDMLDIDKAFGLTDLPWAI